MNNIYHSNAFEGRPYRLNDKNHGPLQNVTSLHSAQYKNDVYFSPIGIYSKSRYPFLAKYIDQQPMSQLTTIIKTSNKRTSSGTHPESSSEELMRLKRLKKDTEDSIKEKGRKLQYKQLSLKLKKKLKDPYSHLESTPVSKTFDNYVQNIEASAEENKLLQVSHDDKMKSNQSNRKSGTTWYAGDTGRWAGAPSLPDLQLGNEDFRTIGNGSLSKAREEIDNITQENYNASTAQFPQKLIQRYCRLTDEHPHFHKHRKALARKECIQTAVPHKRIRRSSEPSISNTSWASEENLSEDIEDNPSIAANSSRNSEKREANDKVRQLVERRSISNESKNSQSSFLRNYQSELSRKYSLERFSSKSESNICYESLDKFAFDEISLEKLPFLLSPVQRMIEAPKRERRHSFSENTNSSNYFNDSVSVSITHDNLFCKDLNKQHKSIELHPEDSLKSAGKPSNSNDSCLSTLEEASTKHDQHIEHQTNLQGKIFQLLKERKPTEYEQNEEQIILLKELQMKETEKKSIENRQKEIIDRLEELRNGNV